MHFRINIFSKNGVRDHVYMWSIKVIMYMLTKTTIPMFGFSC